MSKINVFVNFLLDSKVFLVALLVLFANADQAKGGEKHNPVEALILGSKLPEFMPGSGMLFIEQNPSKIKIIRSILSKFGLSQKIIWNPKSNEPTYYLSLQKNISKPQIEFRKINPIKYRLRIHNARGDFPIVLSETFDNGWKAYLVPWTVQPLSSLIKTSIELLPKYQILEPNKKNQATLNELSEFLKDGWVTDIKNKLPSETTLHSLINDLGKPRKFYTTDFISKNYFGSIQNNNLPAYNIWETWFPQEISLNCIQSEEDNQNCTARKLNLKKQRSWDSHAIQWPDLLHWKINAFANSWWIETNLIRQLSELHNLKTSYYLLNPDGSIDFEIVLEFWPQRLFYIGGIFSAIVFCFCTTVLFLRRLTTPSTTRGSRFPYDDLNRE